MTQNTTQRWGQVDNSAAWSTGPQRADSRGEEKSYAEGTRGTTKASGWMYHIAEPISVVLAYNLALLLIVITYCVLNQYTQHKTLEDRVKKVEERGLCPSERST